PPSRPVHAGRTGVRAPMEITKRAHALGAPVQSFEFKVQFNVVRNCGTNPADIVPIGVHWRFIEKLPNEANSKPSTSKPATAFEDYETNPTSQAVNGVIRYMSESAGQDRK